MCIQDCTNRTTRDLNVNERMNIKPIKLIWFCSKIFFFTYNIFKFNFSDQSIKALIILLSHVLWISDVCNHSYSSWFDSISITAIWFQFIRFNYVQSTPDNSNLRGKQQINSSSYLEFELLRVKLYRKRSEGKCKLLRVSRRFEL